MTFTRASKKMKNAETVNFASKKMRLKFVNLY